MHKDTDLTEIREALIQAAQDGTPFSARVERQIEDMCRTQERARAVRDDEDLLRALMTTDDEDE